MLLHDQNDLIRQWFSKHPRPAAAASPGNLLGMNICPRLVGSETLRVGLSHLCCNLLGILRSARPLKCVKPWSKRSWNQFANPQPQNGGVTHQRFWTVRHRAELESRRPLPAPPLIARIRGWGKERCAYIVMVSCCDGGAPRFSRPLFISQGTVLICLGKEPRMFSMCQTESGTLHFHF